MAEKPLVGVNGNLFEFAVTPEQHQGLAKIVGAFALELAEDDLAKYDSVSYKSQQFTYENLAMFSQLEGYSNRAAGIAFGQLYDEAMELGLLPESLDREERYKQPLPVHWIPVLIESGMITGNVRRGILADFHEAVYDAIN